MSDACQIVLFLLIAQLAISSQISWLAMIKQLLFLLSITKHILNLLVTHLGITLRWISHLAAELSMIRHICRVHLFERCLIALHWLRAVFVCASVWVCVWYESKLTGITDICTLFNTDVIALIPCSLPSTSLLTQDSKREREDERGAH